LATPQHVFPPRWQIRGKTAPHYRDCPVSPARLRRARHLL